MKIREATEQDIPEILDVLKASLGETSSKKTEAVWRYKHLDNPFGSSLVLVAVERHKIVGVRALMRWKWQLGERVFSAFRAVDTATHPDHQGKGIFKKLTLSAIEMAKVKGDNFIFNTPNTQSLPGYLKMGWNKIDKLQIRFKLVNPLIWFNKYHQNNYHIENNYDDQLKTLISEFNCVKAKENKLFTIKSSQYLSWRYQNNPLQKYEVRVGENFYFAAYIKEHKYFKELRITEHIYVNEEGLQNINRILKNCVRKHGAHLITSTIPLGGLKFSGNYGPILILRNINLSAAEEIELLKLTNWSYNLGDLELF